jgi:Ca-activated chloride channel family protein
MNVQFQYPWILFLIWIVPVIGVAWHVLAGRRMGDQALVSAAMAAKLAPAPATTRRLWQLSLLMLGLILALIAAARPQWGVHDETVYQRGRDLMVLLDVSRSMLARDVHPSRLGRAKVDLLDLIKELRGDRVGLLAFRGRSVSLCPLTTDYGFMAQTLEGTGVDSAPVGETDIGGAIQEALKNFEDEDGSHKAIILITDGDDLAGKAMEAATQAKEKGVVVFTVGFGSSEGATIPSATDKKQTLNYQGQEVVSKLNNSLLRDIAEVTGGAYVPVGLANVKLGDLYRNHLSRISARDLEESSQRRYVERYQVFLFPAVLLFLAVAFLSRGRIAGLVRPVAKAVHDGTAPVKPPPLPATGVALVLVLMAGSSLQAVTNSATPALQVSNLVANVPVGREGARMAQRLYLAGNYEGSAAAYQAAAKTAAQATRDDYLYNAGCALLKAGKTEEAGDVFRSLTGGEGELGALAAYNLGCALFTTGSAPMMENAATPPDPALAERRVQAMKQAGMAFQKALRQQPDDADSRKNLAVVEGMAGEVEEQAKIIRLMAEHGQAQPGALADLMLLQQRKLIQDIPAAFTNTTPALIDSLESVAAEQDRTADLMIPLKGKLLQALSQSKSNNTNAPQQMAQVNAFAESIRDNMFEVARALRNLDRESYAPALKAEAAVYTLWKGISGYQQLLREDIQRQTNAIILTTPLITGVPSVSDEHKQGISAQQGEAIELTGMFKQRFEQEVPPEGISRPVQQTSTNAAAKGTNEMEQILSPEDRKKIVDLADKAISLQTAAESMLNTALTNSLAQQRSAYTVLKEIEALLPKDKKSQDNQQQNQQQQDQQKQEPQPPQDQKQDKPQEQKPPPKQEDKKDQMSPEDLKRLLDKAKQREKEHEQEKRERDSYVPLSPTERDW